MSKPFCSTIFPLDSTVARFLFIMTMSSTSSDSEMSFDSEDSKIPVCSITEVETEDNDESRLSKLLTSAMTTKLIYMIRIL